MNYTKGERTLYCGDDSWFVEVKDKSNRPNNIIGKFHTKENALLDAAAPAMYEALIEAQAYIARAEMKKGTMERTPLENKLIEVRSKAEGK